MKEKCNTVITPIFIIYYLNSQVNDITSFLILPVRIVIRFFFRSRFGNAGRNTVFQREFIHYIFLTIWLSASFRSIFNLFEAFLDL